MNTNMSQRFSLLELLLCLASIYPSAATELQIERTEGNDSLFIRLVGTETPQAENWICEASTDLKNWSISTLSALEDGWAFDPTNDDQVVFFRARQTEPSSDSSGLYDISSYRTFELEFPQMDWLAQMAANYGSDTNVTASLKVDGTLLEGVGVRFKGDTSYRRATTLKKSFNIEIDHTDSELRLQGYKTLNLNNAFTDPSFMREVLYNNFCRQYIPSPQANLVHLFVNGDDYGVYVNSQQENGDFIEEFFQDNDGDRFRAGIAPNAAGGNQAGGPPAGGRPGGGGPGGGGGGGGGGAGLLGFGGELGWLGDDLTLYESGYILKSDNNPDPWSALVNMIDVLNNSDPDTWPETLEAVLSVDRFLWMLALENLFLDADGYLAKAGDYLLYQDTNTGRIHSIQHDGNETFNRDATEISGGIFADPFHGEALTTERPLTARLFAIDSYRQRYLAHLRTILNETFHWEHFEPKVAAYKALIESDIFSDTIKETSNADFLADTDPNNGTLRTFVDDRRSFLLSHPELDHESPVIASVGFADQLAPVAGAATPIEIQISGGPSVESAGLFYSRQRDGQFTRITMTKSADRQFQGEIPAQLAGTTVYYYVEATSGDEAGTVAFSPSRAEGAPLSFQIGLQNAAGSSIVINELMAKNESTISDKADEFDDWIELHNLSNAPIDVSGMFLSDELSEPRQWALPEGTIIEANGYLLVWADNDTEQEGLHASFKLSSGGETVYLVASDADGNSLLDTVSFEALGDDQSVGRIDENGTIENVTPTPNASNF